MDAGYRRREDLSTDIQLKLNRKDDVWGGGGYGELTEKSDGLEFAEAETGALFRFPGVWEIR